jgi:hypothetical protein
MSDVPIYHYVYGFEYLWLGKVLWYKQNASIRRYQEVRVPPDRSVGGVPPVCKYTRIIAP